MKRRKQEDIGVEVGNAVNLKMDFRDVSHPWGVNGIVYKLGRNNVGSISVVTVHGLIVCGQPKRTYYVPADRYVILPAEAPLDKNLEKTRDLIQAGDFDPTKCQRVSMQEAHSLTYFQSPGGRMKCSCKSKKCTTCKCAKAKTACTSGCGCTGNCGNPNN